MKCKFKVKLERIDNIVENSIINLQFEGNSVKGLGVGSEGEYKIAGVLYESTLEGSCYFSDDKFKGSFLLKKTEEGFLGNYTGYSEDKSVCSGKYIWIEII